MQIEEYKYDFSWCMCYAKESQLRLSSVDNYFLQRYDKKCTYASIASIIFKNDRFIYLILDFVLTQARLKAKYWIVDE